jgi:hypothetical protein
MGRIFAGRSGYGGRAEVVDVRRAVSETEREAIYRFRYEVYVREMGRTQRYADHDRRMTIEPLDKTGRLFGAWCDGVVVGTARTNFARCSDLGDYPQLYSLERAGRFHPTHTAITTKLMVAKLHRGGLVTRLLFLAMYRDFRQAGIEFNFLDCNPPLMHFFRKWGCRLYTAPVHHPEYGHVIPMVLALSDREYLEGVRSPLAKPSREFPVNGAAVDFCRTHMVPTESAEMGMLNLETM